MRTDDTSAATSKNMAGIKYSIVKIDVAKEIIRLSELKIQAQLQIGIAANQRSATLCGIFSTSTIAVMGAVFVYIDKNADNSIEIAGSCCSVMLFAAALCCLKALWPTSFATAGIEPKNWLYRDALLGSIEDTLLNEAENYQSKIESNRITNKKCAIWFKMGASIGCAAPIVSLLIWLA